MVGVRLLLANDQGNRITPSSVLSIDVAADKHFDSSPAVDLNAAVNIRELMYVK
jgi:hypothetical protein